MTAADESCLQVPQDVISQLPTLPRLPEYIDRVPVLITTSAFASWLGSSNAFLKDCINHIFQHTSKNLAQGGHVYSIAAVVDKLPAPAGQGLDAGNEGFAFTLVPKNHVAGELLRVPGANIVSGPEIEPTLYYSIQPSFLPGERTELGVRVANTLFTNGRIRTMFASQWKLGANEELELVNERDLGICRITESEIPPSATPEIPLHAVTDPRKIAASMGNIVRQVYKGDKSIPASAELERALPQFLNDHGFDNQRLAVWALVQHPGADAKIADSPSAAIQHGSHLYRVVGGGGGWGKKQGLLSLDPEFSYQGVLGDEQEPIANVFQDKDLNVPGEQVKEFDPAVAFQSFGLEGGMENDHTALREIIKPGDFIQFFVAPLDSPVMPQDKPIPPSGAALVFGVIPPAHTYTSATSEQGSASERQLVTFHGFFGALSESAMTFRCPMQSTVGFAGTKIDVPGSRISLWRVDQ